jgi:hypothetical protein
MIDAIVEEVRRIRDAYAARFNYDLDAIYKDIKKREKKAGYKFVNGVYHPKAAKRRGSRRTKPSKATE